MVENCTENEYQPARIAPPDQSYICAVTDGQRENCRRTSGKIIRVRPSLDKCMTCGGGHLIVHPEDFAALGISKELSRTICSSQVEMD